MIGTDYLQVVRCGFSSYATEIFGQGVAVKMWAWIFLCLGPKIIFSCERLIRGAGGTQSYPWEIETETQRNGQITEATTAFFFLSFSFILNLYKNERKKTPCFKQDLIHAFQIVNVKRVGAKIIWPWEKKQTWKNLCVFLEVWKTSWPSYWQEESHKSEEMRTNTEIKNNSLSCIWQLVFF